MRFTPLVVKAGDMLPVTLRVNHDLSQATTRLLVRHLTGTGVLEELVHEVRDAAAGRIVVDLDGTWAPGDHFLELKIEQFGVVRTAPTTGLLVIRVVSDLDVRGASVP